MRLVNLTLFFTLISSCFFMSVTTADIAMSGYSSHSIMVSSDKRENANEYILEITIEGIDPRAVTLESDGQMLILEVKQGNIKSNTASASQNITYTYSFADNANLHKLSKLIKGNKIEITIPKR